MNRPCFNFVGLIYVCCSLFYIYISIFKNMYPDLCLPPQPIVTRWGTWLHVTNYYCQNFQEIKNVDAELDATSSMYIGKIKIILLFNLFLLLFMAPLHFLVLFIGLIILFQLTFTFIYNTFSKNFSVSAK